MNPTNEEDFFFTGEGFAQVLCSSLYGGAPTVRLFAATKSKPETNKKPSQRMCLKLRLSAPVQFAHIQTPKNMSQHAIFL